MPVTNFWEQSFLEGMEGDEYYSGDGEHYQTPGYKISEARAVTLDYQGNVIITENDRGFIRKIQKEEVEALIVSAKPYRVKLYPNPAREELHLEIDSPLSDGGKISILNASGHVLRVLDMPGTEPTIDIHDFQSGIYFLHLEYASNAQTLRFVIEK